MDGGLRNAMTSSKLDAMNWIVECELGGALVGCFVFRNSRQPISVLSSSQGGGCRFVTGLEPNRYCVL